MKTKQKQEYKLEIDPKILQLLGPNLYTNIYYIIAELIANAYDADAKNVYIYTMNKSIIVEDDGTGMSYEDTKKYLNVAEETRTTRKDSYTKHGRRKIGRKGVGKLAALSVSENVFVKTIKDGKKSGFILSRNVGADKLLTPLSDKQIKFRIINRHGTSIEMKDPQFRMSSYFETIKRNILKIFPLVSNNFRIHIIQNGKKGLIDSFDREMIKELGGLIILGYDFKWLAKHFKNKFPKKGSKLLSIRKDEKIPIKIKNKAGKTKKYDLIIKGWVGAYASTRGRKKATMAGDFPDNFISLLANNKLGEYNILPIVGKNKLREVYVVGQLHVDLFEETELEDMALSNRQGYKTEDPRYQKVISFVTNKLLPEIVELRNLYGKYEKEEKVNDKLSRLEEKENQLRNLVEKYKDKTSNNAAKKIADEIGQTDRKTRAKVGKIIRNEINTLLPLVGIKSRIDDQKKRILICHTKDDKDLADTIYNLLIFNRVPPEDIIYTNCDDEVSRIPDGMEVWDYLKKFFMESYSNEKIYVVYVTSKEMAKSWGAVVEVGAGWITRIDHKVFNIEGHTPSKPLDTDVEWQNSSRRTNVLSMTRVECDKFALKIESICRQMGYRYRSREENIARIMTFANIV